MFAVCDTTWKLSEALYSRSDLIDTVKLFAARFPGKRTLLVFRDLHERGSTNDLQFFCLLSPRQVERIIKGCNCNDKK